MTADEIIAWIKDTRGIELTPASAQRLAGLIASGRATLAALADDSLFDAEPAQMALALKECAR